MPFEAGADDGQTNTRPQSAENLVLDILGKQGALFAEDIARKAGLLPAQLEGVLAALVARGQVTADGFSPLRWLIRSSNEKSRLEKKARKLRHGLVASGGLQGRWSVVELSSESQAHGFADETALSCHCWALLRRYGVVFRAVLAREALLPPWRYLLGYLRRMEDRGEVLGGRFVDGFSGEQFALPEAVGLLRKCREPRDDMCFTVINATDPLNLGGLITPGGKTVSKTANRVLLEQGVPVARLLGSELDILNAASRDAQREAHNRLTVVSPLRSGLIAS